MSPITTTEALAASGYTSAANYGRTTQDTKAAKENRPLEDSEVKKTKVTNGRTIGEPKLSEKAQKYYDQLRKKFSNMDFILVSKDMKQQAQANAGRFANPNRMVVLIDEEKIERMAEDENYRKQYEGIISGSSSQMSQLAKNIGKSANAGSVKGFGMQAQHRSLQLLTNRWQHRKNGLKKKRRKRQKKRSRIRKQRRKRKPRISWRKKRKMKRRQR